MLPSASGQAQGIRLLPVLKRWRLTRGKARIKVFLRYHFSNGITAISFNPGPTPYQSGN